MTTKEIKDLIKVIPINKDSTNILFISKEFMSQQTAELLSYELRKTNKADFGVIVLVEGNPNHAVKLVSAKDLK